MQVDTYQTVYDAAYQGAPGAYSEEAAQSLLGPTASLLPRRTLEQVFDAVSFSGARHGVVPVENSLAGTVPNVYELLMANDVTVIGETRILIDHVLLAPARTKRQDVRRVLSHPVALAQCAEFFRSHRAIQAVPVFDTAGAVEIVMREDDGQTAAIAARRAAVLYGAAVLAEHLQDHDKNWTRFLLLAPMAAAATRGEGTHALVAFDLKHEPGSLVRVLQPLADRGVNLTKIESRPVHEHPFEYRFVVELTATPGGASIGDAIQEMQKATSWLKVLGTYALK